MRVTTFIIAITSNHVTHKETQIKLHCKHFFNTPHSVALHCNQTNGLHGLLNNDMYSFYEVSGRRAAEIYTVVVFTFSFTELQFLG